MTPALAEEGDERYNIKIHPGDILSIELATRFDIVTAWDVLEHCSDTRIFLERAASLLDENGLLLIRVPDFDFIRKDLPKKLLDRYIKYIYPLGLHEHIFHFSLESLKIFLESAGFSIIDQWHSEINEYTPKNVSDYDELVNEMSRFGLACEVNLLCRHTTNNPQ